MLAQHLENIEISNLSSGRQSTVGSTFAKYANHATNSQRRSNSEMLSGIASSLLLCLLFLCITLRCCSFNGTASYISPKFGVEAIGWQHFFLFLGLKILLVFYISFPVLPEKWLALYIPSQHTEF